jgi:hypothetical protein
VGLSVVSQTRCRIDVFPAFALPITSTRNLRSGIRGVRFVPVGGMEFGGLGLGLGARVVPIGVIGFGRARVGAMEFGGARGFERHEPILPLV